MSKHSGQFEQNNSSALLHGGAIARKHLSAGTPFPEGSPARLAEEAIEERYAMQGRGGIVHSNAARVQAVADLYTQEFFEAARKGENQKRDSYAKIMLWSIRLSNAAWEQDRLEEKNADDGSIEAAITSARGESGNDSHAD